MSSAVSQFERRKRAAMARIDALGELRKVVGLPRAFDIGEYDWEGLQRPLAELKHR